jgi:hypothetical protein
VNLPLRKHRVVDRMLIGHKAPLSLEPERDTQGSDNLSPVARYSCFSVTVTHSVFVPRGRGLRPAGFERTNLLLTWLDNFFFTNHDSVLRRRTCNALQCVKKRFTLTKRACPLQPIFHKVLSPLVATQLQYSNLV